MFTKKHSEATKEKMRIAARRQPRLAFCKRGHPRTPENIYVNGHRACKLCNRDINNARNARSPERMAFESARSRCTNPKNISWPYYGGRGIKFLFINFVRFMVEVGKRPTANHSLDRIRNDGHYQAGNLRWVTIKTQNRNRPIARSIRSFTTEELQEELERRKNL